MAFLLLTHYPAMKRLLTAAFGLLLTLSAAALTRSAELPPWQKGMLDIHTLSTGRGNCQYIVMPDGTTMMIDAGDFDGPGYDAKYAPMRCTPLPDGSPTPARAIADYIKGLRGDFDHGVDYFVLTHFHTDHYGAVRDGLPVHKRGGYLLTGLTELAQYLPVRSITDRDYPDYSFPLKLQGRRDAKGRQYDPSFDNYIAYCEFASRNDGLRRMPFEFGDRQFVLRNDADAYPGFKITNIKKSNLLWNPVTGDTVRLFTARQLLGKKQSFSENPLSCALVIEYGPFRYYAGGDNTGLVDQDHPAWLDLETPMAKIIGRVTAMTLNHHGNRDATNGYFLNTLDPETVILQSWSSDHPGQEVAHRLISNKTGSRARRIFMTDCDPLTAVGIGPWFQRRLDGSNCHIVLRVMPDGTCQTFTIDR